MKKAIFFTTLLLLFFFTKAQQQPIISNYQSNPYIINKAYTGYVKSPELGLTAKTYFLGFANKNPGFQSLNFATRKEYYGMGLFFFNDYFGNTRYTGVGLTYAYHIDMESNSIAFALSPKFSQYGLNESNYIYFDDNDEAISNANEHKMNFDADFGILLYADNYEAGFSVNNLLEPNISLGDNNSRLNKILRTYNFSGKYKYILNDDFIIQPGFFLAYNTFNLYYDLNLKAKIKDLVWVGTGYKQIKALNIMFGLDYKNYSFAYSYDHYLSHLSGFSLGMHEIFLGIRINNLGSTSKY